jgi:hypothetical protein
MRSRAPAGRSPVRFRGWPVTTTRRSRRTGCSPPARPRSRSRAVRRGCGGTSRRSSGSTRPEARASATNPDASRHRDELIEVIEGLFATSLPEHWLDGWRRRGCQPARCGNARRRLRLGADPLAGPAGRRRPPDASAPSSCPARRSASTTTRTAAAGQAHVAPRPSASTTTRSAPGSAPRPLSRRRWRRQRTLSRRDGDVLITIYDGSPHPHPPSATGHPTHTHHLRRVTAPTSTIHDGSPRATSGIPKFRPACCRSHRLEHMRGNQACPDGPPGSRRYCC